MLFAIKNFRPCRDQPNKLAMTKLIPSPSSIKKPSMSVQSSSFTSANGLLVVTGTVNTTLMHTFESRKRRHADTIDRRCSRAPPIRLHNAFSWLPATSCRHRELFSELSNSAEPRITHSSTYPRMQSRSAHRCVDQRPTPDGDIPRTRIWKYRSRSATRSRIAELREWTSEWRRLIDR